MCVLVTWFLLESCYPKLSQMLSRLLNEIIALLLLIEESIVAAGETVALSVIGTEQRDKYFKSLCFKWGNILEDRTLNVTVFTVF